MASYSFTKVGSEYQMGVFPNDDEYTGREPQIQIKYVVAGIINSIGTNLRDFTLVIHGRLYNGANRRVSGASANIDYDSLQDVYQMNIDDNLAFQQLMHMQYTPMHVVGVGPISYKRY